MKILIFGLLLSTFVLFQTNAQKPPPTATYQYSKVLQSPNFYLYWSYTPQNITFELHVKDAAWMMFGLKGPSYSDVIVAGVFDDSLGHFSQRMFVSSSNMTTSPTLEWFLQDAFKVNEFTVIKFHRNIRVKCADQPVSTTSTLNINVGQNFIVFSNGTTFSHTNMSITVEKVSTVKVNLLPTIKNQTDLYCVPSLSSDSEFSSIPTGKYTNQVDLLPTGIYRLYWNVTEDGNFTAEVHVKTQGWVGFGFSENGRMENSNVVVGYIATDGSVNFTDRYITKKSVDGVKIVANQSVHLLAYGRVNEYVYFKFTRPLKLCDSEHVTISVCDLVIKFLKKYTLSLFIFCF